MPALLHLVMVPKLRAARWSMLQGPASGVEDRGCQQWLAWQNSCRLAPRADPGAPDGDRSARRLLMPPMSQQ